MTVDDWNWKYSTISSVRVRCMSDDATLLTLLQLGGSDLSPKKDMFTPPFPEMLNLSSRCSYEDYVKCLLTQFNEAEICLGSEGKCSVVKLTLAKRSFDGGIESAFGDASSTALKEVKIENE